jgi:hypothetical protein
MTSEVRIGTKEDVHEIVKLAVMIHDEIGVYDMSPQKALMEIYPALCQDHGIVGVVENDEKEIVGAVLIKMVTPFYSDNTVLEERSLFIRSDYRTSGAGLARKLCEFCKKVADEFQMPLRVSVENDIRTKGKIRLFERQFGEPIGAVFMYKPKSLVSDEGGN